MQHNHEALNPKPVALDLILVLMRSLSHKIRTPLSVISNDLNYIRTLIQTNDCERGIQKCRFISEIFGPAQLLQSSSDSIETFEACTLLQSTFKNYFKQGASDKLSLKGSKRNFLQALHWLIDLFQVQSFTLERGSILKFSCLNSLVAADEVESPAAYSRPEFVSQIYSKQSSDDTIIPMLVDAVLDSFGAEYFILSQQQFSIVFAEKASTLFGSVEIGR